MTSETKSMSDSVAKLAIALNAAQATLEAAAKDSTNPHFRSNYASLQSVWEAARPALKANGLSVSQTFADSPDGSVVTVVTTLLHSSGEWISGRLTMKPVKADPQGIGSAITYGRRYALAAILGIVADEDDDGNGASGRGHEPLGTKVQSLPPRSNPAPSSAPEVRPAQPAPERPQNGFDWRSVRLPAFVEKKGKKSTDGTVGGMRDMDLIWWANNFTPKEYQGRIQQADIDFKQALVDGVKARCLGTPPDLDSAPPEEKPDDYPF